MYPVLPQTYKGRYPFKIGAPSYIYPDHILPNVKMLAPYLDEIELLFFESKRDDSFPSPHEIETLASLTKKFGITYNVHLPVDVSLTDSNSEKRAEAVKIIHRAIDLTRPLSPSTCTLHLAYEETSRGDIKQWQQRAYQSIEQLISKGINGKIISIETLNYPLKWVETMIADFDLSVCIDVGHLIVHGYDLKVVFDHYAEDVSIIHLSGVENGRDHIALNRMSENDIDTVMEILNQFNGIVSLEVFSYEKLKDSLQFLEKCWKSRESDDS